MCVTVIRVEAILNATFYASQRDSANRKFKLTDLVHLFG
jgi:hypothetical protein